MGVWQRDGDDERRKYLNLEFLKSISDDLEGIQESGVEGIYKALSDWKTKFTLQLGGFVRQAEGML